MVLLTILFFQQLFTIEGSVSSHHFDHLEALHVIISVQQKSSAFNQKAPLVSVKDDYTFHIAIFEAGMYSVSFSAPYHDWQGITVMVDRPDSMHIKVKMDALDLEDGAYYPNPEYVQWIDAIGNFNEWDTENPVRFTFDEADSSIYCLISTPLDTVWYRIYGLNAPVLPGANAYKRMNIQGREEFVAGVVPVDGKAVIRYRPGEYPFPKPRGAKVETMRYQQPESFIDEYFSFPEPRHREMVIQLLKTNEMYSGFTRISEEVFFVEGRYTSFNTVLDSLYTIVQQLPHPTKQSNVNRLQHFMFVRAGLHRLSAEQTLKDKAGGSPMVDRKEMWDAFVDSYISFPPMYPLWSRTSRESHALSSLIICEPHIQPHIEAIALQHPDRLYSIELFFEVGKALEKTDQDKALRWLGLMQERHPSSQMTQNLRDLISTK